MQHIEEAGIHSGDSSSVLPPHSLSPEIVLSIEEQTRMLALELGVVGLMNVQFAVKGGEVYILEVNPRASRTVPFVSKATGRPLAKIAAALMVGKTLDELGLDDAPVPRHTSVKESVFPFAKFPGADTILGPEMRSTGEVMGVAETFARAFGKALLASGIELALPERGGKRRRVFISVKDEDKPAAIHIGRLAARARVRRCWRRRGTAAALARARVPVEVVQKVNEGLAPRHRHDPQRDGLHRDQHDHRGQGSPRQLLASSADAPREHPLLHHHRGGAGGMRRAGEPRRASRRRASDFAPGVVGHLEAGRP